MTQYDKMMKELTLDKMAELLDDHEYKCDFCKYTSRDVECRLDGSNCRKGIKMFLESEVNDTVKTGGENMGHYGYIDAGALMDYCQNTKDGTIDCNDIARFPRANVEPVTSDNVVADTNSED